MHEFSLAQGLMGQLLALADQHNASKICNVHVSVGSLSGIVADSFAFGFEILTRENPLTKDATLQITETYPQYRCLDCNEIMPFTEPVVSCPNCASQRLSRQGGDDLILTHVEME